MISKADPLLSNVRPQLAGIQYLRSWGPLIALVVLCCGFSVADPSFAPLESVQTVVGRGAVPLILAVGMTFIILQGSIDLSIEGLMAASSLTFAMLVLN